VIGRRPGAGLVRRESESLLLREQNTRHTAAKPLTSVTVRLTATPRSTLMGLNQLNAVSHTFRSMQEQNTNYFDGHNYRAMTIVHTVGT